jgi:phosphoglycolate phosphatase
MTPMTGSSAGARDGELSSLSQLESTAPMTCIFDLDGTLVDSRRGIIWAAESAARTAAPEAELVGLGASIGARALELFTACLPGQPRAIVEQVIAEFRAVYDGEGWRMTDVYEGTLETLGALRAAGVTCHIVTNKPAAPTAAILATLGLAEFFDEAVSPDSAVGGASKPEALVALLARRKIDPSGSVFVGDTPEDLAAARHAGVPFVGVEHGYGADGLQRAGVPMIPDLAALPALLGALRAPIRSRAGRDG